MQLDLNLLRVLDALLEEGSVGGAAARLNQSAPAVSRSLGRIRRAVGDPVLVRTGRTMVTTPFAEGIRQEVHELSHRVAVVLSNERSLDLDALDRVFTLKWHDAITAAYGPRLLAGVRAEAPGVRLRFLAETNVDTDDLRRGDVDIAVGATEPQAPDTRFTHLGRDHLVVALRPEHPLASGRMTLARYTRALHVSVSRRGRLHDTIDEALQARGLTRHVIASVPTSTAALHYARHNDVLVAVPERTTRDLCTQFGLRTVPIPLDLPASPAILSWHQRYDNDPAHTWLRQHVTTILAATYNDAAAAETQPNVGG
jgi:DNA-binding transcriptional LysR family regulator